MNDLQKNEFEILKIFVEVCDRLGLTYYLVCGSALGAAKYNGFIPWDDDIDVALIRPEYEVFIHEAPKHLPNFIFLQSYESDSQFPSIAAKLRDSRTTYIEKGVRHIDMHHGVYIDVFPLDGYPQTHLAIQRFEKMHMYYERLRSLSYECSFSDIVRNFGQGFRTNCIKILHHCFGVYGNSQKNMHRYSNLLKSNPVETSELWCNFANWQGRLEYAPKEQYGEGAWSSFEGLRVRIPEKYDEYLTQKYGDWRADLPQDQQIGHHYYEICDLDKPYTYYTEQNRKKN